MNKSLVVATKDAFALLGDRFNRAASAPMAKMYAQAFEMMDLTLEELGNAVSIVIFEDTFFPSPARLVEAARGSLEGQAVDMWDEYIKAISEDRASKVDQIARDSLNSIGSRSALESATGSQFVTIRSKFVEEYTRRSKAKRAEILALPVGVSS
jgi:hypothetical protein